MGLDSVISLERLLAPISDEEPSGADLRYAGLYDQITEARRGDEDLAQGDWKRDIKKADWHKVLDLSAEALATNTKDLLVAAWMAEALVRVHGFPGFRFAMQILEGLLERYWGTMYPANDDDDFTGRANALRFLDQHLSLVLKALPITNSGSADYSYQQWESSLQFDIPENLEQLSYEERQHAEERQQLAAAEGKITGQQWRDAKSQTPRAFYEEIYHNLDSCLEEFHRLNQEVDARFGDKTPGLRTLKNSLDDIRSQVEKIVKEKRLLEPDPVAVHEDLSTESLKGAARPAYAGETSGLINSRTDALNRLKEVADFFRRTEPHSPISYLLERAISWGHMPFDVWLNEVIKNPEVLGQLRETLGIKVETPA